MIVPTPSYTDTVDLLHWAPLLTAFICKPLSKHVFSLRCKKIIFLQWYLASARHIQSFEVGAVLRLVCRFGHVARLVCVCFAFLNTAAFVMRCVKSYHRVWLISIKAIVFQVCCDASDWFESLESDGFHLSKNQTLKKGSWSPWSTQMNSKQDPAYSSMFMSRKVETRIMKWNFMIIWNKRQSLVTSQTVIPWNPCWTCYRVKEKLWFRFEDSKIPVAFQRRHSEPRAESIWALGLRLRTLDLSGPWAKKARL